MIFSEYRPEYAAASVPSFLPRMTVFNGALVEAWEEIVMAAAGKSFCSKIWTEFGDGDWP
jgi:hypothetical protein